MKALEGIRVIDMGHVLAAPTTAMILADLGAEVIHIESPQGDDAREFGPFIGEADKNRSGYFISINRNKKSVVLNLKTEGGKEVLRDLIRKSDVLIENFRPTTMKKLGFGWEDVHRINPKIVYASICGFGHDALEEYAKKPAYDMVAQAYSGLMSITGPAGGPPCRVGTSIGDIVAGNHAAIAILAALISREKTGEGQYYDGSMVDSLVYTLENGVVRYTIEGEVPEPLGTMHPTITPFQGYMTEDRWIIVAIGNDKLWKDFCENIIKKPELVEDPRFKTNPLRTKNRDELNSILEVEMKKKSYEEWAKLFEEYGVPYSPVNTIKDVCEDKNINYRNMIVEIDQPEIGKVKIVGSPFRLSSTPGEVYAAAPSLGQHTDEVLRDVLGYSDEKIKELKEEGAI